MTDPLPPRPPSAAPLIAPPRPYAERRVRSRRSEDRRAHDEATLLARALDVLAADEPADARLAGLLDLLARTVGATRAAVIADAPERRVAVAASGPGDEPAAIALAGWLDSAAPRSRAARAASAPARVVIAHRARPQVHGRPATGPAADYFAALPIPTAGGVTLGFASTQPLDAATLIKRMPPTVARHAAVALALVTEAMATEREIVTLRAAEAERARFVSTVAHELRTPLTGLAGYLDLILDGQVDDPAVEREFMERGRSIVESMAALVDDLLELSRLEAGSVVLEAEPFSVADALVTVGERLLPIAMDRGVQFGTVLPPRIRTALGDRRRIDQILTNLAANALKYAADGGHVELAGRFDGGHAIIVVRDEGPGIDAEDRPRIFERFYRMADHARVTGTGLGLSIARDLARAMSGELDVASLPGTGSSFVLVLRAVGGATDDAALAGATADAVSFELDRLEALAAVRDARRKGRGRPVGGEGGPPENGLHPGSTEAAGLRR